MGGFASCFVCEAKTRAISESEVMVKEEVAYPHLEETQNIGIAS